jgi:murein DD-endopeptidase MepM/ murein hydrolase activator NlpD
MRRCLLLVPIALVVLTSLAATPMAGASSAGTRGSDHVHGSGSTKQSTGARKSTKTTGSKRSKKSKKSQKSKRSKRSSAQLRSASTTPSGLRMHIVARGDSVPSVARLYGVSADDIRAANGIVDDQLYLGARLIIDGSASSDTAPAGASGSATVLPMQRISSATYRSAGATGPLLRCPVRGAKFMNDWGFPRDGGTRFHEGTDLFAPKGTTIVAPMSGTIVYGSNNLGGSTFTIRTADGWEIYGAHISAAIGSSRTVRQGEPIARVGNSGDATGGDYHLHLGVKRIGGRPRNPYPSVLAACR